MRRRYQFVLVALLLALGAIPAQRSETFRPRPLPDFPTVDARYWIQSKPLTTADLRGSVVLLEVWTFG